MPLVMVAGFTFDGDRALWKHGGGVEQGAVMFATLWAVADTNPIRRPLSCNLNLATKAASGGLIHEVSFAENASDTAEAAKAHQA